MTNDVNTAQLCTHDMLPTVDNMRLVVKNPSNHDSTVYSYNYREVNLGEYSWLIEKSATYTDLQITLFLEDLESVPDQYIITLRDEDTGTIYDDTQKSSFECHRQRLM